MQKANAKGMKTNETDSDLYPDTDVAPLLHGICHLPRSAARRGLRGIHHPARGALHQRKAHCTDPAGRAGDLLRVHGERLRPGVLRRMLRLRAVQVPLRGQPGNRRRMAHPHVRGQLQRIYLPARGRVHILRLHAAHTPGRAGGVLLAHCRWPAAHGERGLSGSGGSAARLCPVALPVLPAARDGQLRAHLRHAADER